MWKFPTALDDDGINFCKRQSVCELEGDAAVEGSFGFIILFDVISIKVSYKPNIFL